MTIFLEFIFRLRIIYVLLELQTALRLKQRIEKVTSRIIQLLLLLLFLYARNIYVSFLISFCFIFIFIFFKKKTLSGGKLLQQLDESRTFGNWTSTRRRLNFILWFLVCFHIFYGPFCF
jgi:hypothetical protein